MIIDRVSLTSVENRGSIGGIPFADAEIRVPNLVRDAELNVAAADQVQLGQILDFLRQTPVSALLGPTLESVTGSGNVATAIDLQVPIASPKDYRLLGTFALEGRAAGAQGRGLRPDLTGGHRAAGHGSTRCRAAGRPFPGRAREHRAPRRSAPMRKD